MLVFVFVPKSRNSRRVLALLVGRAHSADNSEFAEVLSRLKVGIAVI